MGLVKADDDGNVSSRFDVKAELVLKIVLVGAPKSGKTSLVRRLCDKPFRQEYVPTLGFDVVVVPYGTYQGRAVSLHLWDVAGSQLNSKPCHHSLIAQGAEGVLYVLDVTSRDSLQAIDEWDRALSKYLPPWSCKLLVGHKADLPVYVVNDEALSLYVAGANGFRGWCLTVGNSDYGDYDVAARRGGGGARDADGRYKGQSLSGEKQLSVSEAMRTLINYVFRAGGAGGAGTRSGSVVGLGVSVSGAFPLPSPNLEAVIQTVEGLGLGSKLIAKERGGMISDGGMSGAARKACSMRELLRDGSGPGAGWRRREPLEAQKENGETQSVVDPGWRYFAGRMDREDAEALLRGRPEGTFFLRRKGPALLVLTYVANPVGPGGSAGGSARKSIGGASPRAFTKLRQRSRMSLGEGGLDGRGSNLGGKGRNSEGSNTSVQHALLVYEDGCFGDEKGRLGRFATLEELLKSKISAIARYPLEFRMERGRYVVIEPDSGATHDGLGMATKTSPSPSYEQPSNSPRNPFASTLQSMVTGNPFGAQSGPSLRSRPNNSPATTIANSATSQEAYGRISAIGGKRSPTTSNRSNATSNWEAKETKGKSTSAEICGESKWMQAAEAAEKSTESSSSRRTSRRRSLRDAAGVEQKRQSLWPWTATHGVGKASLDSDGRLVFRRPRKGSMSSNEDGSLSSSATESVETDGNWGSRPARRIAGGESVMAKAASAAAASAAAAVTATAHPNAKLVLDRLLASEAEINATAEAMEVQLRPLARKSQTGTGTRRPSRSSSSLSSPRQSMSPSERLTDEERRSFSLDAEPTKPRLDAAAALLIDRTWSSRHDLLDSVNAMRERAVSLAIAEAAAPPAEGGNSWSLSSPTARWAAPNDSNAKNSLEIQGVGPWGKGLGVANTYGVVPASNETTIGSDTAIASRASGTPGRVQTGTGVISSLGSHFGLGVATCADFDRILGGDGDISMSDLPDDDVGRGPRGFMAPEIFLSPGLSDIGRGHSDSRGGRMSAFRGSPDDGVLDGLARDRERSRSPLTTEDMSASAWRKILLDLGGLEERSEAFVTDWNATAAIMVDAFRDDDDDDVLVGGGVAWDGRVLAQ